MSERWHTFAAICALAGGIGAGLALGYLVGSKQATQYVMRECAADGDFDVVLDGIEWTYTCSKPMIRK